MMQALPFEEFQNYAKNVKRVVVFKRSPACGLTSTLIYSFLPLIELFPAGTLSGAMAVLKEGIATIRTGAGIVYDFNPIAEAHDH